jgi:acid stress-induced BolA-like protein IbaG/YrbA
MMNLPVSHQELEKVLAALPEVSHVSLKGDGYHYELVVVSDAFIGQSKVTRQQWVYRSLGSYITSGKLHALSMQTLTREEWEQKNG